MDAVKELLDRRPPEVIYHYTSFAGFEGIVKSRTIWATDIRFLNDRREFDHAISLSKEILDKLPDSPSRNLFGKMFKGVLEEAFGGNDLTVCISSFSERADLLSQWRGYCPRGQGVCFGLRAADLSHLLTLTDLVGLAPCEYNAAEQRRLVADALSEMIGSMQSSRVQELIDREKEKSDCIYNQDGTPNEIEKDRLLKLVRATVIAEAQTTGANPALKLFRVASLLKDAAFAEEAEWRLVFPAKAYENRGSAGWDFRSSASAITPYIVLPLVGLSGGPLRFADVIIGPSTESE